MMRLQKIVVGMDWSPASMDAWREACLLARTFGSRLVLVHAVPETSSVRAERDEVVLQAEATLHQLATEDGVEAGAVVEEGRADDVLLAVAAREGADLIVLGAGARTTLDRVLLGSSAERLVREAPVPVWLVCPGRAHPEVRSVLCALDGDLAAKESDEALRAAVYLCRTFVAGLSVMTVVPDPDALRPWARGEAADLAAAVARGEEGLRRRLEGIDRHGVETRVIVRAGRPAAGIVEAAGLVGCDLLVMGTRGLTGLAHLWSGSTAERVIRAVPSSVLVVKAR